PGDVPADVEIALADGWESHAAGGVDRIPPLGVAREHREPGDVRAGNQGPRAEVVPGGQAPSSLPGLIEIPLLKREVAGRIAIGRPQRRAIPGRGEATTQAEPSPDEDRPGLGVPSREVAQERRADAALVGVLEPDLQGEAGREVVRVFPVTVRG